MKHIILKESNNGFIDFNKFMEICKNKLPKIQVNNTPNIEDDEEQLFESLNKLQTRLIKNYRKNNK